MKINKKLSLVLSSLLILNIASCKDETQDKNDENNSNEQVEEHSHEHEEEFEEEIVNYDYEEIIKKPTCTETGEKLVRYGDKEKTLAIAPIGHSFSSGEVIKQPSETEKGIKEYKCVNLGCEEVIREEFELKDSFKTYTEDIIKAATCEEDGLKEYKILNSGVEETIQEVIPALGHNFIEDDSITKAIVSKPSNTDPGKCKYLCSRCKTLSEDTFNLSNKDFFYTEGLKKLCNYDMKVYPYLQKLWREIETGLESAVKKAIDEKDNSTIIRVYITRNFDEIPDKPEYADVEYKIAHMVRHVNPQYWYLTCSRASEIFGMNDFTSVSKGSKQGSERPVTIKYTKISNCLLNSKNSVLKNIDSIVDNLIKPGMNDIEKICAICSHICSRYYYVDWDGNLGDIVSFYEKGYGVCANYAAMFNYMAQKAGICCVTKTTSASQQESYEPYNHAWNWVLVEGNFYHVDTTWMDGEGQQDIFTKWFLYTIDSASLSTSFFNNFVEPKYIKKYIGANFVQLYKNGKTQGMYSTIDKALEKIKDYSASYVIDCNIGFHRGIQNPKWFTHQTKVDCKELTFCCTKYNAEIEAPKEFFENNNIKFDDKVRVIYR